MPKIHHGKTQDNEFQFTHCTVYFQNWYLLYLQLSLSRQTGEILSLEILKVVTKCEVLNGDSCGSFPQQIQR